MSNTHIKSPKCENLRRWRQPLIFLVVYWGFWEQIPFPSAAKGLLCKIPLDLDVQFPHFPQGFPSSGARQFRALVRIRAALVFPTPLEPLNRNA